MSDDEALVLDARGLESGYGKIQVLWGVDIDVRTSERVVLLGANGAGKTTLLRTLVGLVPAWGGSVRLGEDTLEHLPTHERIRRGIALMSEVGILPSLSVEENLMLGGYVLGRRASRQRLGPTYELFPELKPRRREVAGRLSGGQRKMLAFGKVLMSDPRLVVMDEPSTGLSPMFVSQMVGLLREVHKQRHTAMLIAEQNIKFLEVAERVYVLEGGVIRFRGSVQELRENDALRRAYFGLEGTPTRPE